MWKDMLDGQWHAPDPVWCGREGLSVCFSRITDNSCGSQNGWPEQFKTSRAMRAWMFLWLGMLPLVRTEELPWGIMSVFLKPMPLTHSVQVFPWFFTFNASLQLPFFYAASAKEIVVFSDDSKYFTDEWLCSAVSTKANTIFVIIVCAGMHLNFI